MAARKTRRKKAEKTVTRYTYDDIKEPRIPETGHMPLLPDDEKVVTLPLDNGWSQAIEVGRSLRETSARSSTSFARTSAPGARPATPERPW